MAIDLGIISLSNAQGLWGLLFLIPFIIIYLIRPRPILMKIPSVMFLLSSRQQSKKQSFFRRFLQDLLFLLQLLIMLLLIAHLAEPLMKYQHDVTAENTVVVIDVSASMQTLEGGQSRLKAAIQEAEKTLSNRNSIILAKSTPALYARDIEYRDAVTALNSIRPSHTPTALGESIIFAGEVLAGKDGRVIVFSDFLNTKGMAPLTAKAALKSKGIVADFFNVAEKDKKDNLGIVGVDLDEDISTVFIKNFNEKEENVVVTIGATRKELTIGAKEKESFAFETPGAPFQIKIEREDDFWVDNVVHISAPSKEKAKILLISNNQSVFLKNAFRSNEDVELGFAEPPVGNIANIAPAYGIFVLNDVDAGELLPGTLEEIKNEVRKGKSLIIYAQEDSSSLNYQGLLPVKLGVLQKKKQFVQIDQLNQFTKNVDFGVVERYFEAEPKENVIQAASVPNAPLIAVDTLGAGKILYYGLLERFSDFKFSPSFPIFWKNVVDFLTSQENIRNLNYHTGETLIFDIASKAIMPSGKKVEQNHLVLDEQGIYDVEGRKISANLLDEDESQVTILEQKAESIGKASLEPVTEEREFKFSISIAALLIALFILELVYVKRRGDF